MLFQVAFEVLKICTRASSSSPFPDSFPLRLRELASLPASFPTLSHAPCSKLRNRITPHLPPELVLALHSARSLAI